MTDLNAEALEALAKELDGKAAKNGAIAIVSTQFVRDLASALRASAAQLAKLREPTFEMLEAGWCAYRDSDKPAPFNQLADGFRAMVAEALSALPSEEKSL